MSKSAFAFSKAPNWVNLYAVSQLIDPAIDALNKAIAEKMVWGQVLISRRNGGFGLRHVTDTEQPETALRLVPLHELRELARFSETGAFRPLKAAPTLRSGWHCTLETTAELNLALNQLYPGSVPDWYAAHSPAPPVTHYREFTQRQTGMYRVTTFLTDDQAADVTRAVCHPRFCLKQRLWTVGKLPVDLPEAKSAIPCLEPCAVLLEMARKAARIEQEKKVDMLLAPSEAETVLSALKSTLEHPDPSLRVADFSSPSNPRRVQLLLEKLSRKPEFVSSSEKED